jgi:polysaccharide biosynthesis/export protein
MKPLISVLVFLTFVSALMAQKPSPATPANTPAAATTSGSAVVVASDYKINSGDQMQFGILGEPETSTVIKVSQQGTVSLPFIGDVKVLGLSVSEARTHISNLYKPDFYIDPQINLIVTSGKIKIVSITGAVNRPGPVEIPADGDLYLWEAIGKAGDFSRVAKKIVYIRRVGPDGKFKTIKIDAEKIGPKEIKLEPDDIINVDEFGIWGP